MKDDKTNQIKYSPGINQDGKLSIAGAKWFLRLSYKVKQDLSFNDL